MRRSFVLASILALGGCVELGVVGDGTSLSTGRASRGRIIDGVRMPDRGEGFFTREAWRDRGNRYGTQELVDLLIGVSRRVAAKVRDTRIVIADLSARGGGEVRSWHRSHQSGRDVDICFFQRDPSGKPVEPETMRHFGPDMKATDGSGFTVDIPRTWILVKEIVTAREANVQWAFLYNPIVAKLVEYAESIHEPEELIAKVKQIVKQPGDSVPHDDHIHIRVYCTEHDKQYGCLDYGPMEPLAERQAEDAEHPLAARLAAALAAPPPAADPHAAALVSTATTAAPATPDLRTLLVRSRTDRLLTRWR